MTTTNSRGTSPRSSQLAERARELTPGGVHSNVRMNAPMVFFERGEGAWLFDVDGNDYVDHLLGQGPNFLGHAPKAVTEAVAEACRAGTLFGGQHELEIEAGEAVLRALGWADTLRFGVSGTEMVHAAIRVARGHTGRRKIVRFEGHYHGWLDSVLIAEHDGKWGPATLGQNDSDLADQIILPWNDPDVVSDAFARHGEDIAAIITEPMMVNVGAILPRPGYLEHLRNVAHAHGALLILDEVICGFRLALGGAAERFGVTPDIATYGKAIAGGWPVAAMAGRREIMEPIGRGAINHSGTFNSSVMSMAAVVAALQQLTTDPPYQRIESYGTRLQVELAALADRYEIPLSLQGLPVAFHASIGVGDVHDAASLARHRDSAAYAELARVLVDHGVWVAGRGVWYTSAAHGDRELEAVVERADAAFAAYSAGRAK
jgi:glutamate-1-semialdehyde 2,1-aminomutase